LTKSFTYQHCTFCTFPHDRLAWWQQQEWGASANFIRSLLKEETICHNTTTLGASSLALGAWEQ
jgi:hypothetical protein